MNDQERALGRIRAWASHYKDESRSGIRETMKLVYEEAEAALAAREEPTCCRYHSFGNTRIAEWNALTQEERTAIVAQRCDSEAAREDTERHEHVAEHKGDFTACMRCGRMPDHPIHEVERRGHVFDHAYNHDLTSGIWTCQCGYTTSDPDAIEAHREDTERPDGRRTDGQ